MFRFYLVILLFLTSLYLNLPLMIYHINGRWIPVLNGSQMELVTGHIKEINKKNNDFQNARLTYLTRLHSSNHTPEDKARLAELDAEVEAKRRLIIEPRSRFWRELGKHMMPPYRFGDNADIQFISYFSHNLEYRQPSFSDILYAWIGYYMEEDYWPWVHALVHLLSFILVASLWLVTGILTRQFPRWMTKTEEVTDG